MHRRQMLEGMADLNCIRAIEAENIAYTDCAIDKLYLEGRKHKRKKRY